MNVSRIIVLLVKWMLRNFNLFALLINKTSQMDVKKFQFVCIAYKQKHVTIISAYFPPTQKKTQTGHKNITTTKNSAKEKHSCRTRVTVSNWNVYAQQSCILYKFINLNSCDNPSCDKICQRHFRPTVIFNTFTVWVRVRKT